MRDIFKRELFSIRKFSIGVASVLIGANMLSVAQPIVKQEAQAKEKIDIKASSDVRIILKEENGGAKVKIQAVKDIKNADVKVTLAGKLVATYHIDSLKKGETIEKEVTKEQLEKIKEEIRQSEQLRQQGAKKSLPKTSVVRKSIQETLTVDGYVLAVALSYDVEEDVNPAEPNKPGEPSQPSKPNEKPSEPSQPNNPNEKPGEPEKPNNLNEKPEEPSQPSKPNEKPSEPSQPSKPNEKPRTKAKVETVFVIKGKEPVLDNLTFQFTNVKNPNEVVEKTLDKAMLVGEELYLDEEYKLTLKNSNDSSYTFDEIIVKAKKVDDFVVLHNAKTNKAIETIFLKEKDTPSKEDGDVVLDKIIAKVISSVNKPIANAPFRLFEYDRNIPNIVKEPKTNAAGEISIDSKTLKPNTKYDLRIEKRDTPFLRENVVFLTDEKGKIATVDNKPVNASTSGVIEFKEEKANDKDVKTAKAHFRVVDENGNPVKNVELSASGIRTKITTLKDARSDENGIVTLDLESKVNGVNYIVNVSKNDQFNWQFKPDAVSVFVTEEGTVNYTDSDGKYSRYNYNGEEIPVFVVKKIDVNHLKTDLRAKIAEAEEILKTKEIKELRDLVNSAKEELAKKETLPIYIGGYLNDLTKEIAKIKQKEDDTEEEVKKGIISTMIITKNDIPALEEIDFEFVSKKDPNNIIKKTSSNGILTDIEVNIGEGYTIRAKSDDYVYEQDVEIRDEGGEAVAFKIGTEEPVVQINLTAKKTEKPTEVRKKGSVEFIAVSDEKGPNSAVSFKFENIKHPEDTVVVKPKDGILKNTELYLNEEYKVTLVDDSKYTFESVNIIAKDEDGEVTPYIVGTDDYFDEINLKTKTKEEESNEEDYAYRDSIVIRALEGGAPVAETEFTLIRWDGNIPNQLKVLKTDKNGMITLKVLNSLPSDSTYQLISRKNSKKYVTFYSDDEGYLWNINGRNLDSTTPKIIDINL